MAHSQPINKLSSDITSERIAALKDLIPEAFTEGKIDFAKLKESLGEIVDDGPERYNFTWAGKKDAIRTLQAPTDATLVPRANESVDWETTQNVFVEGDNLEVLKILYRAYNNLIKLIYIDPPYNTGNDFVYVDNYTNTLEPYRQLTGQADGNGHPLSTNKEDNGRFHSAWLTMMYPRLFLARQLLRDDGLILISIDDGELHNLKLICNEIFGDEAFVACFVWKSRQNRDNRSVNGASIDHEYVLCYGKSIRGSQRNTSQYSNPDNDQRGPWSSANMVGLATADRRPNLHYDLIDPATKINYGCPRMGWRYDKRTMAQLIDEGRILWPATPDGRPRRKAFFDELESDYIGFSTLIGEDIYTRHGTGEIDRLFNFRVFDFPKPSALLTELIAQGADKDDIILDFFGGSGTTAQAILELNEKDGGHRKFILVQLPEPTGRGDFRTISEITTERIRRLIELQNERDMNVDISPTLPKPDRGFRSFMLAPSHFRDWSGVGTPTPEAYLAQMRGFGDPLFDGFDPYEVVWEIAIKEGYPLTSRIERLHKETQTTYRVTDYDTGRFFHICLEPQVTLGIVNALNLRNEDLFICRDIAIDDTIAANLALNCRLKTI